MEKIKTRIVNFVKNNYIDIILITVICVLIVLFSRSCTNYRNEKVKSENNIIALTDSIKYYQTKAGDLMAEKQILIGDIDLLKYTNSKLSNELGDMKVKYAKAVIQAKSKVDYGKHDTIWRIDTVMQYSRGFNFDNQWRKLNGSVACNGSDLSLKINEDIVNADLTFALVDNKVLAHSDNPYLKINCMDGIVIPEYEPTWCLVVGPSINLGYGWGTNFNGGNCPGGLTASVGISVTFGWNIAGVGKRIKKAK